MNSTGIIWVALGVLNRVGVFILVIFVSACAAGWVVTLYISKEFVDFFVCTCCTVDSAEFDIWLGFFILVFVINTCADGWVVGSSSDFTSVN